nr:integrase [Caudoviricetes sp.]CAI9751848.1 integrase [Caudoviricetes sp.]
MGKSIKVKEPVKLRAKTLADGSQSLYLDIYKDGRRRYEFLKLYLLPESGKDGRTAKAMNEATLKAAQAIKTQRILDITYGKANMEAYDGDVTLGELFSVVSRTKGESSRKLMDNSYSQLRSWAGDNVKVKSVDRDFVADFISHLKETRGARGMLKDNTIHLYCVEFSAVLNYAVKHGIIAKNPFHDLDKSEMVKGESEERTYLSIEEVKAIAAVDKYTYTRNMFLFSCFCGLRISDILSLKWGELHEETDGHGQRQVRLVKRTLKTGYQVAFRLPEEALKWLPERTDDNPDSLVFADAPARRTISEHVSRLAKLAKIQKKITFHSGRHTFATLMLTMGADLYTTSKILGHTRINTTEIYAKIIDKKKDDAVSLIDNIM